MILSNYTVIVEQQNKVVLFSTITRAVVGLDLEKGNAIRQKPVNEACFTKDELQFLRDKHLVVDEHLDETKLLWHVLNKDRLKPSRFSSYIAISTNCNFACTYCYEQGQVDDSQIMRKETLQATINWYRKILCKNKYSDCHIVLYGGEPLLYKDKLMTFVKCMCDIAEELSVNLTYGMITNGSLLNTTILDFLVEHGLNEIQVTLDGSPESHNMRRKFKDGTGTFDIIFQNLKGVLEYNIDLTIRISFDEKNNDDIESLLLMLKDNGFARKRTYVYFAPIHQTTSQKTNTCSFCSQNALKDYNKIAELYCKLYKSSYKLGFWVPTCYTNGPCMTVSNDSCLIAPNGLLYKCVEMIGKDEFSIGNVYDSSYAPAYYDFIVADTLNACIANGCKFAPMCGGGCAMEAYIKCGNINKVACHKEIFRIVTECLLNIKYGDEE